MGIGPDAVSAVLVPVTANAFQLKPNDSWRPEQFLDRTWELPRVLPRWWTTGVTATTTNAPPSFEYQAVKPEPAPNDLELELKMAAG